MFQILEFTEAHVASVTNRQEKHGDESVPAVSIGMELTAANTILDQIDAKLREALYKSVDGQEQLPGVEPSTPVLRCNSIDRATLPTVHEGWTLEVDDNLDDSTPMRFGGVKVDKFSVEPKQGGSIVLRLRCGTSDIDAERLGKLGMHNGQSIWITLTAPKPKADAIDGTTAAFAADHPEAGDLFAVGQDDDGSPEDSDDSEGGDPDVEAGGDDEGASQDLEDRLDHALDAGAEPEPKNWPFPRNAVAGEAPPQSVTVEPRYSQKQTRTARGRDKTKAALAAGVVE